MYRRHNQFISNKKPSTLRQSRVSLHLGTNSLLILLPLIICAYVTYAEGLLNWGYLKGLEAGLAFTIGFLSISLGMLCFKFWKLGERSIFAFHLLSSQSIPDGMLRILVIRDLALVLSAHGKLEQYELKPFIRKLACIAMFFCILLSSLDNRGFNKIKAIPENYFSSGKQYCPDREEERFEDESPKQGCALVIKAHQLGYVKDLGQCAPKQITPEALSICTKRRRDEPYLHYAVRLVMDAGRQLIGEINIRKIEKLERKIELQWHQRDALKDYQLYAMSAAPRASHHIWTNLPYPDSRTYQVLRDFFNPSHCLYKFQNQTNTVASEAGKEINNSKILQHVYGQLLFNPKVKRSVAFCKEYKIHWQSDENTCERLTKNPETVLDEHGVLSDIKLVLKRHGISQTVSYLDEALHELSSIDMDDSDKDTSFAQNEKQEQNNRPIDTSKIAKNKRLRDKNNLVSFNCFMQKDTGKTESVEDSLTLNGTEFLVRTHQFPVLERSGEAQVDMYKQFSKSLEKKFHYSQYTSRSELELQDDAAKDKEIDQRERLQNSAYRLARLELLNDVDIFLGNEWVLEREDLLEVYPFHLHLQNYVESFRIEYQKNHGRL